MYSSCYHNNFNFSASKLCARDKELILVALACVIYVILSKIYCFPSISNLSFEF